MNIDAKIRSLKDDLIKGIMDLVAIPSLEADALPGAPFGAEVRRALDAALDMAKDAGFETRDFDGFAGDATLASGAPDAKVMGILAHVDVVPAGEGWSSQPFTPEIRDGRIYGRGSSDDKGPIVAALIAMRAVKELGVPLKNSVRLVLGCNEESGWACMNHYREVARMPDFGFSPDACFPLVNAEKGILKLVYRGAWDAPDIISIEAGTRDNVVPGKAEAVFGGRLLHPMHKVAYQEDGANTKITVSGAWGHAAMPDLADNAAVRLCGLLAGATKSASAKKALSLLASCVPSGAALGVACCDEASGALTCNLGLLSADERGFAATFNIRYPVTVGRADVVARMDAAFAPVAVRDGEDEGKGPLYCPEDAPLVSALLSVYDEVTGGKARPIAIGGGTYARAMDNCVAFGVTFPDEEDVAHQANEYIGVESALTAARIYARAIIKLCGA